MSSIDQRVVEAKFDNKQFQEGVQGTLNSLDSLKKGLKLDGATKGLEGIDNASKKVSLQHISDSVDKIAGKFNALSVAALATFATIVSRAASAGINMAKSFSVKPIMDGLNEYETQLNSIQTILANTQWQHTGLKDVNNALNELNTYSDKTIYNFTEMARNIGTFTAAGVKLDTSVAAIKGIANLAAISGSSADQASTAMYQLSQALASGTVKLMDWNSVVNAGMGGKVFQDALKETARAHGVAIDQMIKDEGSFRESLKNGWLTSGILTETLSKFTGDMTAAQLKQLGYTDQQIKGIMALGKTAQDAATKVKTFHQLIDTLKEAAGSGWAQSWQIVIGDFGEAKMLWTTVSNVLGTAINQSAKARNKILSDWKALGGRAALIDTISSAFKGLISILKPIKEAFREIFPPMTGKRLYDLTVVLFELAQKLKIGAQTAENLKRTFAGVFAILDIGWQIIKAGVKFFLDLFSTATKGSGGFLKATANVGDFLVALDNAVKKGEGLTKFFGALEKVLKPPIELVKRLADALFGIFDFKSPNADQIITALQPLGKLGELISYVWGKVIGVLDNVWRIFEPFAAKMGDFFSHLGMTLMDFISGIKYEDVLSTIRTALLGGAVLLFKQFVDIFKKGSKDVTGGFFDKITAPFEELTGTLSQMQKTLRATTLLQIAAAIGIMTASVIGLSRVDAKGLTRALTAMTVMFTQLFASVAIFERIGGAKGLAATATGLILLATAVRILTSSVKALSTLSWKDLAKGLTGLTVMLGALAVTVRLMSGQTGGMVRAGAGLLLLAAGIKVLVSAVTDLSGLSWGNMAKGLTGVAALLTALALFTKFSGANNAGVLKGAGIILLATGIKILASALKDISKLSWGDIAKGLVGIAGGLVLISAALNAIPPSSVISAGGVLIVSAALEIIANAMKKMGKQSWGEIAKGMVSMAGALTLIGIALAAIPPTSLLSAAAVFVVASSLGMIAKALGKMGKQTWGEIAKGLVTLAGALTIIAAAMYVMTGTLAGAAATLVVANALMILAPVLKILGGMSWGEIAKGLVTLAGVFVILGAAGLVLTPLVPTLLGLGAAIALLGVGVALAGAGVLAFSAGLTALSISGAAGATALVAIVSTMLGILPMVAKQLGLAITTFAEIIGKAGPAITKALTAVLMALMDSIIQVTPKITQAFMVIINSMLDALIKNGPGITQKMTTLMISLLNELTKAAPKMVTAATNLIVAILTGIGNNIGRVVTAGANIVISLIQGIAKNEVKIINAGIQAIIDFINGVAKAIDDHSKELGEAGGNLAVAIIEGMVKGLAGGVGTVVDAAKNVAKSALKSAEHFLGIHSPSREFARIGMYSSLGLANGLEAYSGAVENSAVSVGSKAMTALQKSMSSMSTSFDGSVDIQPTITPVLDLSNVKKNASQLGSMLAPPTISLDSTYSKATYASAGYEANKAAATGEPGVVTPVEKNVTFIQNNTSPKALSAAEIYRQTKNQLSVAKGALTSDANVR